MTLLFIRGFFLIISSIVGYYIGLINNQAIVGTGVGCLCGIVLIVVETSFHRVSVRGLSSMVFGLLLGVFMAQLISNILALLPLEDYIQSISRVILTLVFSYLGAVMALRGKDEFNLIIPYVRFKRQDVREEMILLDTSAIIDGRIADIYRTDFLAGHLIVPRFVLQEMQRLSDSSDSLKRQRGRRGMEILRAMQKDSSMDVRIQEEDFSEEQSVDDKLVRLAKILEASICTTDYNLSRVATIQGVSVLNIHDLVNAVKVVIFPEEELDIRLIKDGKEAGQAIAYTDDGTMIVVSNARQFIGQRKKVKVSSVLQTQAGRIIFAKLLDDR
ncbi:MAG: PIN domain-containing protein [Candidatus Omnitrophota bacterium]